MSGVTSARWLIPASAGSRIGVRVGATPARPPVGIPLVLLRPAIMAPWTRCASAYLGDAVVPTGSPGSRALRLKAAGAGAVRSSVDQLVDGLWGDHRAAPSWPIRWPCSRRRLRGVLGAERLLPETTSVTGWSPTGSTSMRVAAVSVDERACFRAAGRPARPEAAATAALSLARGPLLPDELDAEWAETDRHRADRPTAQARTGTAQAALLPRRRAAAKRRRGGAVVDHDSLRRCQSRGA